MAPKHKFSNEALAHAVHHAHNWREVALALGACLSPSMQTHLKRRAIKQGVDATHFPGKHRYKQGNTSPNRRTAIDVLVRISYDKPPVRTHLLRKSLLEIGRVEECSLCGNTSTWQGRSLTLEIDHIDGDRWNNLSDNLRFLCPNCHTQAPTSTHSRKAPATLWSHKKKQTQEERQRKRKEYEQQRYTHPCARCGKEAWGAHCRSCAGLDRHTHINWPSDDILIQRITEHSPFAVAKELGVSDNAIRHRLQKRGYKVTRNGVIRQG